ncbi:MAG: hypothetical protein HN742_36045 [Lentisphaerae bacterium]|jgi:hypothetical protein|nr:hypothetical protein [Lentisphaerota bacterium]MBT5606666.1 hypothetical protein [Lentisphaerota bacterium]MBT7847338.1 hypothetical protein [Lentisphaerota bacterium]
MSYSISPRPEIGEATDGLHELGGIGVSVGHTTRRGLVLLAGLSVLVFTTRCGGWGVTHSHSVTAAMAMLPQWEQAVWRDQVADMTRSYCMFPDKAGGKTPEVLNEVRPYLYYGEKGWLLHYFPAESEAANRERASRGFVWVAQHVISDLKAGELDRAARYAGGLTHTLGDASCPIHSLEGPFDLRGVINLVHAPPPEDPYFNVWAAFWSGGRPEASSMITQGYEPCLLGETPAEIGAHLYFRYRDILAQTRRQLVEAIDCIYTNEPHDSERWRGVWNRMGLVMPRVIADLYHSCMCIAFDRITAEDRAGLAAVRKRAAENDLPAQCVLPDWPTAWSPQARRQIAAASLDRLNAAGMAVLERQRQPVLNAAAELDLRDAGLAQPGNVLNDYNTTAAAVQHHVTAIARALRNGDDQAAARAAGVAAAVFAERASPVRCLDGVGGPAYQAFAQLFAPPQELPDKTALDVVARRLDAVSEDTPAYRPRLLGTSPDEAAFHGRNAFVRMAQESGYGLVALVQAHYSGDTQAIAGRVSEYKRRAAEFAADLLYTAACIAQERFIDEDMAGLQTVDLTQVPWLRKPGYAGGPYRSQPIVFGASLQKEGRKKVPLQLRLPIDGGEAVRTFERGIGVGGHAKWSFDLALPPGVFASADMYLGMHATLGNVASYGKEHGAMQLGITVDQAVLFDSGLLTPESLATHAVVDVSAGGRLRLSMADRSGHWANYGNQVVYGEPTLIRSPDAPRGLK